MEVYYAYFYKREICAAGHDRSCGTSDRRLCSVKGIAQRQEISEKYLEAIEKEEIKVAKGDYRGSLRMFTNAMCLEYLEMVVKRVDFQNLYSEFFRIYRKETFGFSVVSPEFMQHILEKKTDKDKEQTAAALRNLPDTITIFRGGNTFSVPYDRAFSWTTDINTASFFAARQGKWAGVYCPGRILGRMR